MLEYGCQIPTFSQVRAPFPMINTAKRIHARKREVSARTCIPVYVMLRASATARAGYPSDAQTAGRSSGIDSPRLASRFLSRRAVLVRSGLAAVIRFGVVRKRRRSPPKRWCRPRFATASGRDDAGRSPAPLVVQFRRWFSAAGRMAGIRNAGNPRASPGTSILPPICRCGFDTCGFRPRVPAGLVPAALRAQKSVPVSVSPESRVEAARDFRLRPKAPAIWCSICQRGVFDQIGKFGDRQPAAGGRSNQPQDVDSSSVATVEVFSQFRLGRLFDPLGLVSG